MFILIFLHSNFWLPHFYAYGNTQKCVQAHMQQMWGKVIMWLVLAHDWKKHREVFKLSGKHSLIHREKNPLSSSLALGVTVLIATRRWLCRTQKPWWKPACPSWSHIPQKALSQWELKQEADVFLFCLWSWAVWMGPDIDMQMQWQSKKRKAQRKWYANLREM